MKPHKFSLPVKMLKLFEYSPNAQIAFKLAMLGLPVFPCNSGGLNKKKVKTPLVCSALYYLALCRAF